MSRIDTILFISFYVLVGVDFLTVLTWIIQDSTWIISISNQQLEVWDDVIIILSCLILLVHIVNIWRRKRAKHNERGLSSIRVGHES